MELRQLNDFVPIITLVGLLANIWISWQARKTVRAIETYKVSAGFREKTLDYLRDGRKRMATRFDLAAVTDAIKTGKASGVLKNLREDYMRSYEIYSELRYLFHEDQRTAIDELQQSADKCDAKCWEAISDVTATDKEQMPEEWGAMVSAFVKAATAFRDRLLKGIDEMMTCEASALRKTE